jgi:adenosylhomocysteine nucleosidase
LTVIDRIAVIAGVEAEADAFLHDQSGRTETLADFSIRYVSFAGKSIAITCCGVGKVNAATAATLLARTFDAQLLIIIGTAGKIGAAAGDCFLLHEAVQNDYGAHRPDGFTHYRGGSWPIGPADRTPFHAMDVPECNLPRVRIASGDAFIECPARAQWPKRWVLIWSTWKPLPLPRRRNGSACHGSGSRRRRTMQMAIARAILP